MGKEIKTIAICAGLIIYFAIGFYSGYRYKGKKVEKAVPNVKVEASSEKVVKPEQKAEGDVGVVTVPVGIALKEPEEPELPQNSIIISPMSGKRSDSSKRVPEKADLGTRSEDLYPEDSFRVQIPIKQRVYEDSSYTAYVSGYNANLDSLIIRSKVITHVRNKYRRWNLGIIGGYGFGFQGKRLEPFVGVGITWNVFR